MSTPEVRLAVALFAVHPLSGSRAPPCHCAFGGDLIDGNLPAITSWTEECFTSVQVQVLSSANTLAAWTADPVAARLDVVMVPAGKLVQTRRVLTSPHGHVTTVLTGQHNGSLDWHWLWTNMTTPMMADASLATACSALLDCF